MKWCEYWEGIENHVRSSINSKLYGSCGGICADDIVQDIALEAWIAFEDGILHSRSYWAQRSRWKSVDTLRKRQKESTVEQVPETEFIHTEAGVYDEVVLYLGQQLADLLLEGVSLTECAQVMGVSKATMSRKWTQAKKKAVIVNLKIKCTGQNIYSASLYGSHVATGWYSRSSDSLQVKYLQTLDANQPARQAVYEEILKQARLDNQTTTPACNVQEDQEDVSSLHQNGETLVDIAVDISNATEGQGNPLEVLPMGWSISSISPLDIALRDGFPATLDEWREHCGGKGYCQGGSGKKVKGKFAQGWNATLKSALKKTNTENARRLLAELGW